MRHIVSIAFACLLFVGCGQPTNTAHVAPGNPSVIVLTGHTAYLWSAKWSPDGTKIATVCQESVRIWDAKTGDVLRILPMPNLDLVSASLDLPMSGLEYRIFSGMWQYRIFGGMQPRVSDAEFSPDGQSIAIVGGNDAAALIVSVETGRELRRLARQVRAAQFVAWSPDGRKLVTAAFPADATGVATNPLIWDATTGEVLTTLQGHDPTLRPDNTTRSGFVRFAAFSPDGTKIVTTGRDETARLWDVATGTELHKWESRQEYPARMVMDSVVLPVSTTAVFSPDGKKVATGTGHGFVRVWDVESGEMLYKLAEPISDSRSIVFSPDGTKIATTTHDATDATVRMFGVDNIVRIWDAETGEELHKLEGHPGIVNRIAFSPDGTKIATTCILSVRIWDVATGQELQKFEEHRAYVHTIAFSPDGTRVVFATAGNVARIWTLE